MAVRLIAKTRQLVFSHELVAFQGGRDLIGRYVFPAAFRAFRTQNFADATQVHGLRALLVECDYILDGTAKIGFSLGGEKHPPWN